MINRGSNDDKNFTGDAGSVSPWTLPSIGKNKKVVKSSQREKKDQSKEKIENVPRHAKPKPLTAEQLQNIADQAQQEGYADGFKEGMEKGLAQGEKKGQTAGEQRAYRDTREGLDSEKKRITEIANRLMAPMLDQDTLLEKQVVDLALRLTQKLVADTIQADPNKLGELVGRALAALPVGAKNVTVFVNEEDAKLLDDIMPQQHRSWRLCDDNRLASGGCRVESAESLVDFSIEKRFEYFLQDVEEMSDIPRGDVSTSVDDLTESHTSRPPSTAPNASTEASSSSTEASSSSPASSSENTLDDPA